MAKHGRKLPFTILASLALQSTMSIPRLRHPGTALSEVKTVIMIGSDQNAVMITLR